MFGLPILPLLGGRVLLGVDDTPARTRGPKVFGVGMHHDPLPSTRRTSVKDWGHCRVILVVILKPPFCGDRRFCLPILSRLYVPKTTAREKGLPYHTKPELAVVRRPDAGLVRRHAGDLAVREGQTRGLVDGPSRQG